MKIPDGKKLRGVFRLSALAVVLLAPGHAHARGAPKTYKEVHEKIEVDAGKKIEKAAAEMKKAKEKKTKDGVPCKEDSDCSAKAERVFSKKQDDILKAKDKADAAAKRAYKIVDKGPLKKVTYTSEP